MKSTHSQLVDRSYNFANITERMPVVFIEDAYYGGEIPAGTKGTLRKTFNAGFRGIEADVQLADRRVTVSAGYVKFDNSL